MANRRPGHARKAGHRSSSRSPCLLVDDGCGDRHRLVVRLVSERDRAARRGSGWSGRQGGRHGARPAAHGRRQRRAWRAEEPGNPLMLDLPPIMTNIAAPERHLDAARAERRSSTSRRQIQAWPTRSTRTCSPSCARVKMHQIEGASGFQHLKADLERARGDPQRRPRRRDPDQDLAVRMRKLLIALGVLLLAGHAAPRPARSTSAASARPTARPAAASSRCSALLTVLSVAPGLLIMVTSFTRFVIALLVPALRHRPAERRRPI